MMQTRQRQDVCKPHGNAHKTHTCPVLRLRDMLMELMANMAGAM